MGGASADAGWAEVVVGCDALGPTLGFFRDLGFALELITPADDPAVAVVGGFGLRLRLDATSAAGGAAAGCGLVIRIAEPGGRQERLVAPNGTVVELTSAPDGPMVPPPAPSFELTRLADDPSFGDGRAGMAYRDLLPGRQGGRYIASHILIADGGPVEDYVHHHRIRFQMIFCRSGWVRVVYEGQGPPFVLEAGDCVLQPPGIRHQVLEASTGMQVIEIGCPADHDTLTDPTMSLPTDEVDADRSFGGQRFVRHVAADAPWIGGPGSARRDLGLLDATGGLASAGVVRAVAADASNASLEPGPKDDFFFVFVDTGAAVVAGPAGLREAVGAGDAMALPPGGSHRLGQWSDDFTALVVAVAGDELDPTAQH